MSEPANEHTNDEGEQPPAADADPAPTAEDTSDTQAGYLGFLILGSILYFTLVFTRLEPDAVPATA